MSMTGIIIVIDMATMAKVDVAEVPMLWDDLVLDHVLWSSSEGRRECVNPKT